MKRMHCVSTVLHNYVFRVLFFLYSIYKYTGLDTLKILIPQTSVCVSNISVDTLKNKFLLPFFCTVYMENYYTLRVHKSITAVTYGAVVYYTCTYSYLYQKIVHKYGIGRMCDGHKK